MRPNFRFFEGQPGDLYRPTNGDEGLAFDTMFCDYCQKDIVWRETQRDGSGCPIIVAALCDQDPPEWIYGPDGQPCCTVFAEIGAPEPPDPRQLELI